MLRGCFVTQRTTCNKSCFVPQLLQPFWVKQHVQFCLQKNSIKILSSEHLQMFRQRQQQNLYRVVSQSNTCLTWQFWDVTPGAFILFISCDGTFCYSFSEFQSWSWLFAQENGFRLMHYYGLQYPLTSHKSTFAQVLSGPNMTTCWETCTINRAEWNSFGFSVRIQRCKVTTRSMLLQCRYRCLACVQVLLVPHLLICVTVHPI